MTVRSMTGDSRRPISAPTWPPTAENTAISSTYTQSGWARKTKSTPATRFTTNASTFLSALTRCRSLSSSAPNMATSSTPCAAPK